MHSNSTWWSALGTVVVALAFTTNVSAQTPRAAGPFAGLFGAQPTGNRQVTQSLDVRASLFGVFQDVIEPSGDAVRELDPRFEESGAFGGLSASLTYMYSRTARRAGFFANAGATAASYSVQPETVMATYSASTGLTTQLTRKISWAVSGSGGYAPFYNFGSGRVITTGTDLISLTPGSVPINAPSVGPAGFDQTLPGSEFGFNSLFQPTFSVSAGTAINTTINSRTSFSVSGDFRDQRFTSEADDSYGRFLASATFRRNLTRRLILRLGYRREITAYGGPRFGGLTEDGFEAGLDYGDSVAIPLGRRTSLTLAPQASVVRWNDSTNFRLNGNVTLNRSLGRTWSASTGYRRDMDFVLGFNEPILSDNVFASVGGTIGPRLRWTSGGSWSRGQAGFDDDADSFKWYSATSGLSMALSRSIAVYSQYSYYAYSVPPGTSTIQLLSKFSRQSVSLGLTVYAPLLGTGRVRQ